MCTLRNPFSVGIYDPENMNLNESELQSYIDEIKYYDCSLYIIQFFKEKIITLVRKMVELAPENRPNFKDVLEILGEMK
jgi:hypothetical protein